MVELRGPREVTLWGGPRHGERVMLRDGQIDVQVFRAPSPGALAAEAESVVVPEQRGTYTPVAGEPNSFEWDGWQA